MESINIRQARQRLSELVDGAELGEAIVITRHGKKVAILGPLPPDGHSLPDLSEFRASLVSSKEKEAISSTVVLLRERERY